MAIAPGRAFRPGAAAPAADELELCPFCAGREDRTPPETLRLGDPWQIRVVPNLYPALERQEVVVHTPEHLRSLGDLEDAQLDLVAEAWRRRAAAVPGYVHALVNEGRAAGASLPHSHSQLVWFPGQPPAPASERGLSLDGAVVAEREGLVLLCPRVSRLPFEALVAPVTPRGGAFASDLLAPALRLVGEAVRRLHGVAGRVPLNVWLHDTEHWHLELLPRTAVLAGIELGAGVYVNAMPPEEAAAALRGVSLPLSPAPPRGP